MKARRALRAAFQATLATDDSEPDPNGIKQALQSGILRNLVRVDEAYCESVVGQLSPQSRQTIIGPLVTHYISKRQFARALALVQQSGQEWFPYESARALIHVLPPEMAAERQNLFADALASYVRGGAEDFVRDTFVDMVVECWQQLPPAGVLQAADEILRNAKTGENDYSVTMGGPKGAASFKSLYEYRLFQLMPALRALDPERVQRLLSENREPKASLETFPEGEESLLRPEKGDARLTMSFGPPKNPESAATTRLAIEVDSRVDQIEKDAEKDPKQALAAAMSMPEFADGRARALAAVGRASAKKNPSVAKTAADELLKAVDALEGLRKADYLRQAAELYQQLGAWGSVQKTVDEGFKVAEKLYSKDSEASDPNRSSKATWPSTVVWQMFVAILARNSTHKALVAIDAIPDEEIQSFQRITVANALLDARTNHPVIQWTQDSGSGEFYQDVFADEQH